MLRNVFAATAMGLIVVCVAPGYAADGGVTDPLAATGKASALTAEQRVDFSGKVLIELRGYVKEASRLTESARRDGNVAQLQCLTNRLTSLRALLQVSEVAETALRSAVVQGSAELADHEFRKISVAHAKSQTLASEAQRCTNEQVTNNGDTSIRVEGPLESGDALSDPGYTVDIGFDVPQVSPFN